MPRFAFGPGTFFEIQRRPRRKPDGFLESESVSIYRKSSRKGEFIEGPEAREPAPFRQATWADRPHGPCNFLKLPNAFQCRKKVQETNQQ